jgi:hypothetical protein
MTDMIDWKQTAKDLLEKGFRRAALASIRIAEAEELTAVIASLRRIETKMQRWVDATTGPEIEDVQIFALKARQARESAEHYMKELGRKP